MRLIDNMLAYKPEDISVRLRNTFVNVFLEKAKEFVVLQKDILIELMIIDYKNHNFSDGLTLSDYAGELGLPKHFFDQERILAEIRKVESPYYRARALIRLSGYMPRERERLLKEASETADYIEDPFEQFEVSSYLLKEKAGTDRNLHELIGKITDPQEMIYAIVEMASIEDVETSLDYLPMAVSKIKDREALLKIFNCLDAIFPDKNYVGPLIEETQGSLSADVYSMAIHKRYGKIISETLENNIANLTDIQKGILPLLSLACKLFETYNEFSAGRISLNSLWGELHSDPDKVIDMLYERGVEDGLALTRSAADSIGDLIKKGKVGSIAKLFPLLEDPSSDAIPIISAWLQEKSLDKSFRSLIILILRESKRDIRVGEINDIISLLKNNNDRILLRAELLIHSNLLGPRKFEERTLKGSSIDKEVLYELASQSLYWMARDPVIGNRIRWYYSALVFDDPGYMAELCENILNDLRSVESRHIISSVDYMGMEAAEILVRYFAQNNENLQTAVIECFANCSSGYSEEPFIKELWNRIYEQVRDGSIRLNENLKQKNIMIGNLSYALAVITDKANNRGSNLSLAEMREIATSEIDRIIVPLGNLVEPDSLEFQKLPETIASQYYVSGDFLGKYNSVAEMVLEQPHLFTFILEQIEFYLVDVGNKNHATFNPALSHFLLAAATTVKQNQSSFNNYSRINLLIGLLKKVMKSSARFVNRYAAITLLGYVRTPDFETIEIIIQSFYDDIDVSNAAEEAIERMRNAEEWIIDKLIRELGKSSGTVALNIANVLTSLGRNSKIPMEKRNEIMRALSDCVLSKERNKPIYKFTGTGWKHKDDELRISYEGDLKEKIYSLLLKLNGFNPN